MAVRSALVASICRCGAGVVVVVVVLVVVVVVVVDAASASARGTGLMRPRAGRPWPAAASPQRAASASSTAAQARTMGGARPAALEPQASRKELPANHAPAPSPSTSAATLPARRLLVAGVVGRPPLGQLGPRGRPRIESYLGSASSTCACPFALSHTYLADNMW